MLACLLFLSFIKVNISLFWGGGGLKKCYECKPATLIKSDRYLNLIYPIHNNAMRIIKNIKLNSKKKINDVFSTNAQAIYVVFTLYLYFRYETDNVLFS